MDKSARQVVALAAAICLSVLGGCGSSQPAAAPVSVPTTVISTVKVTSTATVTPSTPAPVTTTVSVTETPPPATVTAEPAGPAVAFKDGQHIVGKDVQPGTYQASATGDGDCYWVRKDQAGEIIDNDFGTVATIQDGDFTFQSTRCGSWSKVG